MQAPSCARATSVWRARFRFTVTREQKHVPERAAYNVVYVFSLRLVTTL